MELSDHRGRTSGRRYIELAQELLAEIVRGDYQQGARLPSDREIASRHGVSRPTAREAFLALELIGAIEVRHGEGAYVRGTLAKVGGTERSPLDAPPRELIETRRLIEPSVARLAAAHIDQDRVQGLLRDLDEATELIDEPSQLPRFVSLGLDFHAHLAPACHNTLIADIVGQLVDAEQHPLWILVNVQAMMAREARQTQISEHRGIVDAVAAGDSQRAEQAMRIHLEHLDSAIFFPLAPAPEQRILPR